jgi:hypothetical protein
LGKETIFSESFDGVSACGDGVHTNCDVTWTVSLTGNATIDFNYNTSPAPLAGSYSARLASTTGYALMVKTFTGVSPFYIQGMFNIGTINTTADFATLCDVRDAAASVNLATFMIKSGKFQLYDGVNYHDTGITALTNTTYWFWMEYTKGTGANAIGTLYISTTAEKPGSPSVQSTDGNGTADAGWVRFQGGDVGRATPVIWDGILAEKDAAFSGSPYYAYAQQ